MSQAQVDMSLDDIIKTKKVTRGRGRGRGSSARGVRGGGILRKTTTNRGRGSFPRGRWQQRGSFQSGGRFPVGAGGQVQGNAKLTVSNLEYGVSDDDIRELFKEFGTLKRAAIHYDRSGRSMGVAEVTYAARGSAVKALNHYNGVPLDGRPMKIHMADSAGGGGGFVQQRGRGGGAASFRGRLGSGGRGVGGARGRGSGRGGRGGGGRGGNRPAVVTKEQLDAEMDAYNSKID